MLKHTPFVPTFKPHSQARGAESSSQNAGSLGEEIIRICVSEVTGYELDGQSLNPGRCKAKFLVINKSRMALRPTMNLLSNGCFPQR
jgi:hypothetical protein